MPKLVDAFIEHGEIAYVPEVPTVEPTSETTGNVTINNMGSPGTPAHFVVTFSTNATFETSGVRSSLYLRPNVVVTGESKESAFEAIEGLAAKCLAPMLREIADKIERQVEEYEAKKVE